MFTTGFCRISCTEVAPVGLGAVEGMPPHDAQLPMAMTAAASAAHSFTISMAVWPPTLQ
jgi:hypothetical protein